eukprot:Tamp_22720.p1 GENE.Tamp_22720~~Tamp_22720.p1  ORF type:complete len:247 (-),score=75.01 Tamp_22720:312-1052(-)
MRIVWRGVLLLLLAAPALSASVGRMAPKIKLTYFNIEGVAEKVRLAFKIGGVEFEDVRVNFPDWAALKPKTPFGQLPFMNIDDAEPVAQSGAMLRYAGKLGKLYPEDMTQAIKVDEIIGLQEDMSAKLGVTIYVGMRPEAYGYPADWPDEEKKACQKKLREKMCEEDGDLCTILKMFEGKLAASGTGYFVGDCPTIADCAFLPVVRQLRSGRLDHISPSIVDKYPKIVEFETKMNALPAVKAHYGA